MKSSSREDIQPDPVYNHQKSRMVGGVASFITCGTMFGDSGASTSSVNQ